MRGMLGMWGMLLTCTASVALLEGDAPLDPRGHWHCINSTVATGTGSFPSFQVCTTANPQQFSLQVVGRHLPVTLLVQTSLDGCIDEPNTTTLVRSRSAGTAAAGGAVQAVVVASRQVLCAPGEYSAHSHVATVVDTFSLPQASGTAQDTPAAAALAAVSALEVSVDV